MDAQRIDRLFEATEPTRSGTLWWYALMGITFGALLATLFKGEGSVIPRWILLPLPWLVILFLLVVRWISARRDIRHRRATAEAWDQARLEAWPQVEQSIDVLMNRPIRFSSDRCQVFILLARLAERKGLYEQATRIYERLLVERIGDGYQLQKTQLALSSAKLRNEELTDGVRMLDRLERVPMPLALRAIHSLIRLYQQVFMGHYEDAVEKVSDRHALFQRYLSTRAGFGYGLMAAAMHHLDRREEAAGLWLEATTLIPAARLVKEYHCLETVSRAYPATEHCL